MSVDLTIVRADGEAELLAFGTQRFAEDDVKLLAAEHGFRILDGVYPTVLIERADLDQVIHAVAIVRDWKTERFRDPRFTEADRATDRMRWERIIARLEALKSEQGWQRAYFG